MSLSRIQSRWLPLAALLVLAPSLAIPAPAAANELLQELGRSESRIRSAAYPVRAGGTIKGYGLATRLDRLGYARVKARPQAPGEYFWGFDVFWLYRRAHRLGGDDYEPRLLGLRLDGDGGRVVSAMDAQEQSLSLDQVWIEPEVLAESLDGDRARRRPIRLADLPKRVWQPVLAAEDGRFFDHLGLDGRSLARALLANVKAGKVTQGGSTITQQLIKNRDLTPRRTLGRKASEAVRSLAVEAAYDKEEILEAYLDQVYLGHVDGLAVHGFGTAAWVYFGREAKDLDLVQAATLAAMIQGPNRLQPTRHPQRARERRNWVLGRMAELGWASQESIDVAQKRPIRVRSRPPEAPLGRRFLSWVREIAKDEAGRRLKKGRGVVAETSLDPLLQAMAEEEVAEWRLFLRKHHLSLREVPFEIALVTLDVATGEVLAHVGGESSSTGFDRARQARRQPGSAVKPLVLLEALEDCGARAPLNLATRIADEELRIDLPSGPWEPKNFDLSFRGVVTLREALRDSLNVPFARIGRYCGERAVGFRLRRAGLEIPSEPPPSMVLGAVETSPVELASAYTAIAGGGDRRIPRPVLRLEKPGGWPLERVRVRERRVVSEATAFLVHDLLRDAVRNGTASDAALKDFPAAAKTGTSSERRDAWLAGYASGLVTVVWVGRDDAQPLGLTGSRAAAPLWRRYMERAAAARPAQEVERPSGIVTRHVDRRTGLRVLGLQPRAEPEIFRRGAVPRRDRLLSKDQPASVLE